MDCQTLEDALHAWRWVAEFNENGDIWHLYFRGDKSGHDLDFFKVLAPFVRDESYIIMRGEDGEMWRWFFKDKTCIEQNAIITWSSGLEGGIIGDHSPMKLPKPQYKKP